MTTLGRRFRCSAPYELWEMTGYYKDFAALPLGTAKSSLALSAGKKSENGG